MASPVHPFTIPPDEARQTRAKTATGSRIVRSTREQTNFRNGDWTSRTTSVVGTTATKIFRSALPAVTLQGPPKTLEKTAFFVTFVATSEESLVSKRVTVKTIAVLPLSSGASTPFVAARLLIRPLFSRQNAVVVTRTTVSPTVYLTTTENSALPNLNPNRSRTIVLLPRPYPWSRTTLERKNRPRGTIIVLSISTTIGTVRDGNIGPIYFAVVVF